MAEIVNEDELYKHRYAVRCDWCSKIVSFDDNDVLNRGIRFKPSNMSEHIVCPNCRKRIWLDGIDDYIPNTMKGG